MRHHDVEQVLDGPEDDYGEDDRPRRNHTEVIRSATLCFKVPHPAALPRAAHRVNSLPDVIRVRLNQAIASSAAETGKNQSRNTSIWSLASGIPVGERSF